MTDRNHDDDSARSDARPLSGIRVVEAGEYISAAYATKVLHDLGADVIKLEPRAGDRLRLAGPFRSEDGASAEVRANEGGLFAYLNAGKRSAAVDLAEPSDFEYALRLIESADVLVHNLSPSVARRVRLAPADLERCETLIYTSITPFGLEGPRADWAATDLTVLAAGGWAYLSPGGGSDPDRPPVKPFGHCADFQAGIHAALVTLAALHERDRSGLGQTVDVSAQECIAGALEGALVRYLYVGEVASRLGQWSYAPRCVVEAADGMLFINILEDDQWGRFVELMGSPEWARAEVFADREGRAAQAVALKSLIADWARDQRIDDFFRRTGEAGLPCSPVMDVRQILESDHLKERSFFQPIVAADGSTIVAPGSPFSPGLGARPDGPAPALDTGARPGFGAAPPRARGTPPLGAEPNAGTPLAGVRVLDLSWVWAGPYCTLNLAHLGAEVIRVESRNRLDIQRRLPPYAGNIPGVNRAGLSNQWNLGKRSVTIDFSLPAGQALVRELAAVSDIVVENFSVGTLDRYGLGWSDLGRVNPALIMVSLSAFGATGPSRNHIAYGSTQVMMSGLATLSGEEGDPPTDVGLSYGDPNAGLHGAVAALAALRARDFTGQGCWLDLSQWEALLAVLPEGLLHQAMRGVPPRRLGNRDPQLVPHGFYRASGTDAWVSIAVQSDRHWPALARLLGVEDDERLLTARGRRECADVIDSHLEQWTRERSAWESAETLQEIGVAAFPLLSTRELATDPHLAARGFFVRPPHAEIGEFPHTGAPWHFSRSSVGPFAAAPLLGADNEAVLQDLLGKSPAEITELSDTGVLR